MKEFWSKLTASYESEELEIYKDSMDEVCAKCKCKTNMNCKECPVTITYEALRKETT